MNNTILIVEDEIDILELLEYSLQKEGYETIGFLSVTDKLYEIFEEEQIDLILMDRNLPGIEGTTFIKDIKQKGHDVPVIYVSAKDKDEDILEGFEAQADDYITKPFKVKELNARVKAVIKRTKKEIDVGIATIGYTVANRWLKNRTKSVDFTLIGWGVALICYPPFNSFASQLIGYHSYDTYQIFTNHYVLAIILALVLLLYTIYVWSTVTLGLKFSNLTNRGIVTNGPFKYVRHPAYSAKNIAWWVDNTFVLTNIWATLSLMAWNVIYILRGTTEEKHLENDKEYKKYQEKVKYRFIPKVV
jgi:CheY-like chemotaxis protein